MQLERLQLQAQMVWTRSKLALALAPLSSSSRWAPAAWAPGLSVVHVVGAAGHLFAAGKEGSAARQRPGGAEPESEVVLEIRALFLRLSQIKKKLSWSLFDSIQLIRSIDLEV